MISSIEKAKSIAGDKHSMDALNNADNFYIVLGSVPDDNCLFEFHNHINFPYWKLRGPHEGPYQLANNQNDHNFMHGFVYLVEDSETSTFEKEVTFAGVKTGYTAEKYSIKKEREKLKVQHFNTLFEM